MPDWGHVALEVIDTKTGEPTTYLSFWPEQDSLMGRAIEPFKARATRHPASYKHESEPEYGFMQRPADHTEVITGSLDEALLQKMRPLLSDMTYDLRSWNCSSVCEYALIAAMRPEEYNAIKEEVEAGREALPSISAIDDWEGALRYISTSGFVNCRPEDVRRLAMAYNRYISTSAIQEAYVAAA